jgi:hypothetical protein
MKEAVWESKGCKHSLERQALPRIPTCIPNLEVEIPREAHVIGVLSIFTCQQV